MGWADCKTGASPPRTVSGLGLPSHSRATPLGRVATPSPSWGEASSHPLSFTDLFSFLAIQLLPSYGVRKEGTGT